MSRSLAVALGLGLLLAAVPGWAQTANIYVAFGDSITEGVGDSREPDEGYPTRLEALLRPSNPNATVRNRGVGGERTPEGLTRIDEVLLEGGDVLLLMEGTNDVSRRFSPETTRFNLSQMAQKAEAQGLSVVHGTIIPRIPRAETDPENFANQDLNERVRDLAGNRNRRLADNFEVFGRQANLFATFYYTGFDDKVGHPNGAGYELMARTFFEAITGADTVAPVTGLQSPKHGARNVRASEQIAIEIWDFGTGIDVSATQLLIEGVDSGVTPTGSSKHLTYRVVPAQPMGGIISITLRSRDLANPANSVDREISRFTIGGTRFLDGDFNRDGIVDGEDLIDIARSFGSELGEERFRFAHDLNDDGAIDGADLAVVASNFGRTIG